MTRNLACDLRRIVKWIGALGACMLAASCAQPGIISQTSAAPGSVPALAMGAPSPVPALQAFETCRAVVTRDWRGRAPAHVTRAERWFKAFGLAHSCNFGQLERLRSVSAIRSIRTDLAAKRAGYPECAAELDQIEDRFDASLDLLDEWLSDAQLACGDLSGDRDRAAQIAAFEAKRLEVMYGDAVRDINQ